MSIKGAIYKISPCKSCACCPTCDIFNAVGPEAVSRCDHYAPIVEVGQWIVKGQEVFCSRCDKESGYNHWGASAFSNYCPNCGAKMEG